MKKIFFIFVFSSFFVLSVFAVKAQTNATTEAQLLQDKIEEKLNIAKLDAKAYIGLITDKTEDSLQIKNDMEEIILVSVNENQTDFVKVEKQTTSAKYSDVAIGDYIIAMGFVNQEDVLSAKRIIITTEIKKPDREIFIGNILSIENKIVKAKFANEEFQLSFPKRWDGPEIKELKSDDKITVVGVKEGNKLNLRTISILK